MLSTLSTEVANNLRSFSHEVLPSLEATWLEKHILSALSRQKRRVETNNNQTHIA
jgi:hypothetical protein